MRGRLLRGRCAAGGRLAGREDGGGAAAFGRHADSALVAALDRADRFDQPRDELGEHRGVDRDQLAGWRGAERLKMLRPG